MINVLKLVLFVFIVSLFTEGRDEFSNFFYFISALLVITYLITTFLLAKRIIFPKGILIFSTFILFSVFNHFLISKYQSLSQMMIYRLIVIDIFLLVIYNCTYTLNLSRIVRSGFGAAILMNTLILLGLDPYGFSQEEISRFSGSVANSNIFANMMICGVLILFYDRWVSVNRSFSNLILIILGVINIFASGSRAALFAASILGSFIIIKLSKERFSKSLLVISFLVLVMLIYTLYGSDLLGEFGDNLKSRILNFTSLLQGGTGARSDQYRLLFLQKAFESFRQNLFWGIGLGGLTGAIGHYAHNNFLELLADVGLIGTLVYYYMYYSMYMKVKSLPDFPKEIVSFTTIVIALRCVLDLTIVSYYLRAILIFIIYVEAMIDVRKNKVF